MKQDQVFFLDLDDTLLDTHRIKQELFHKLATVMHMEGGTTQSIPKVQELYNAYCQSHGAFNYQDFCNFLLTTFPYDQSDRELIKESFNIDFPQYLMPNAAELVTNLRSQGKVIIWTIGTLKDQKTKLTSTNLLAYDEINPNIVEFPVIEAKPEELDRNNMAIVDLQKLSNVKDRLSFFQSQLGAETRMTVIDNQATVIQKVIDCQLPNLNAVWFDNGIQKNEQTANELRKLATESEVGSRFRYFSKLSDISNSFQPEGKQSNWEQKG